MAINGYGSVASKNDEYAQMFSAQNNSKSNTSLSLDDFLVLLSAQLSNQDMLNPMSDAEFIGQLAQFSSLEAMQQLTQQNYASYSASLLGKEVTVARALTDSTMQTVQGTITGVAMYYDEPVVFIDGGSTPFSLSEIMVVGEMPEKTEPEDPGDDD